MNIIKQTKDYLIEVKAEIKKVSWPSRNKAVKDSFIVAGISLATAAFLGGVDYFLSYLVDEIIVK